MWPVFVAFVATVVTGVLFGTVAFVLVTATGEQGIDALRDPAILEAATTTPSALVVGIAVSTSVTAAVALIAARLSPTPLRERLRLTRGHFDALDVLIATIGSLAFGEAFSSLMHLLGLMDGTSLDLFSELTSQMSPPMFAVALLFGSLGAGTAEELLFRGYMQTRLVARWGPLAGVAISAVLFGLVHFDPIHTPFAIGFGFYVGWLTERRGTIVLPILVHILNNAASFVMSWLVTGEASPALSTILVAACTPIAAGAVFLLARRSPRP